MENKKMSCWDFVFSSVKTHIDDLVRQADKYTKDMNEDFEHFFCWYAEDMYKTQRELSCYRALKVVLSAGSHDDVKLYMESKILIVFLPEASARTAPVRLQIWRIRWNWK